MRTPLSWKKTSWNIALVIAGLLFGFVFAAQWNIEPVQQPTDLTQARENLAETIQRLEVEQESLKAQISELRTLLAEEQDRLTKNTQMLEGLQYDLEAQRMVAGVYPLQGPGVRITLADSPLEAPVNAESNLYIIHDYDLRDVVTNLWNQGAEAITINNERIVGTTSIYCVGSTVMVNSTRLASPYTIQAIGDTKQLEKIPEQSASLQELQTRARAYGLQFKITAKNDILIPAYRGSVSVQHAQPGG